MDIGPEQRTTLATRAGLALGRLSGASRSILPRRTLLMKVSVAVWLFIFVVSAADAWFLWLGCETAEDWESNPVALAALRCSSVAGVVFYRAVWLGFAWFMAHTHTRLSWLVTPVWGTSHLYLLVVLVRSFQFLAG